MHVETGDRTCPEPLSPLTERMSSNRPFLSCLLLLFQSKVKCKFFEFYLQVNAGFVNTPNFEVIEGVTLAQEIWQKLKQQQQQHVFPPYPKSFKNNL